METKSLIKLTIIGIILGAIALIPIMYGSIPKYNATQKDYNILKQYAIEAAKDYSFEVNDIKINRKLGDEYLDVNVESTYGYSVEARFPISMNRTHIEKNELNYSYTIDYNNVSFSQVNKRTELRLLLYLAFLPIAVLLGTFIVLAIGLILQKKFKKENFKITLIDEGIDI